MRTTPWTTSPKKRQDELSGNKSMKTSLKHPFPRPSLIAGLGLILVGRVTAQTFTNLYCFTAGANNSLGFNTNSDGASPVGSLISGNTRYGTAYEGGGSGQGTVFAIDTDGTAFTTLHSFTEPRANPDNYYRNSYRDL